MITEPRSVKYAISRCSKTTNEWNLILVVGFVVYIKNKLNAFNNSITSVIDHHVTLINIICRNQRLYTYYSIIKFNVYDS